MIWFLLLIWLLVSSLAAGPQEEAFLQAARLYHAGDYEKALELYLSIKPKNNAIWYNMGNSAYHKGDYVQACLWWKKAEYGASSAMLKSIHHNITKCYEHLGKQTPRDGLASFVRHVYTVLTKIHVGIAQGIFLLAWCCLLIVISFYGVKRRRLLWCFGTVIVAVGGVLLARHCVDECKYAIIKQETVTLYAGPDDRYHALGNLECLDSIRVQQQIGEWLKVTSEKGVGWIPAHSVEMVIECP